MVYVIIYGYLHSYASLRIYWLLFCFRILSENMVKSSGFYRLQVIACQIDTNFIHLLIFIHSPFSDRPICQVDANCIASSYKLYTHLIHVCAKIFGKSMVNPSFLEALEALHFQGTWRWQQPSRPLDSGSLGNWDDQ